MKRKGEKNVKKMMNWLMVLAIFVLLIDWGVMGIKLYENEYEIQVEAWIALICIVLLLFSAIYRAFQKKCPHCGAIRLGWYDEYCSRCGKKL